LGISNPSPAYINQIMASGDAQIRTLCRMWQSICISRKRSLYAHSTRLKLTMEHIAANPDRKILVVGESIHSVEAIYHHIKNHFEEDKVGREHSQLQKWQRKRAIVRFQRGDYRILVSARTLDTGANFPEVDLVVIHSSSSNVRQFIQRIGRSVRKAGQPIALVIRPFTIGTSDDLAIENLIEADVLDRAKITTTHWLTGEEIVKVPRSELTRMSLLTDGHIKCGEDRFKAPKGLDRAVRKIKPKGGVFYYNEKEERVHVKVDGVTHDAGHYVLDYDADILPRYDIAAPMSKAHKTAVLDYLRSFSSQEE